MFHFLRCSFAPAEKPRGFKPALALFWGCIAVSLPAAERPEGGPFTRTELHLPIEGKTGFAVVAPEQTGVLFTNILATERNLTNSMLLNGSGVAAGDIDGDGLCDFYVCALDNSNALFRNLGNWRFTNIAVQAGVECASLDCTGTALADLDGDSDLDLVVNTFGSGTLLFYNDGKGRFTEAPRRLNPGKAGMSTALGDTDGDGWLELYVANYRGQALLDQPNTHFTFKMVNGRQVVNRVNGRLASEPDLTNRFVVNARGGINELGELDAFFRNNGGTNFVEQPFTGGAFLDEKGQPLKEPPFDWGLSVFMRDINQDGLPDIFVCNDFDSPDRFWLNEGNGQFRAMAPMAVRKTSFFSMGADFADIDRNGHDDLFVLDMATRDHQRAMTSLPPRKTHGPKAGDVTTRAEDMVNMLFLNRGDQTYAEIARLAGVEATDWSWTAAFLDVDLDGYEDLLVTNGYDRDARNMDVLNALREARGNKQFSPPEFMAFRKMFPRLVTPNFAFRNGTNLRFQDVSSEWGFDLAAVSNGMCLADLDNDGDLDVIVNNMNSGLGLFRNDSVACRVGVRLKGLPPNTRGIGARITVLGGPVTQSQEMVSGGRYLSCDDSMRTFSAGAQPLEISVRWRSGRTTVVKNALANHLYEIQEAGAEALPESKQAAPQPWFEDVTDLIGHRHAEDEFDDFARQPLLPRKLVQAGPGIAFADLDGDTWDELIISAGRGGRLGVFRNDRGRFQPSADPLWGTALTRDQLSVLPFAQGGTNALLTAISNYRDGLALGPGIRQYTLGAARFEDVLSASSVSFGPMTMGDLDGDGALELFVGGRAIPGKYPLPVDSFVYRLHAGKWILDETNTTALKGLGLANGAVFGDVSGDGWTDLVVACEWGPVRLFLNEGGQLKDRTDQFGLADYKGLWNSVGLGDLNNDGRLDIIAGNWGKNHEHQCHRSRPIKLYHGDLNGDGSYDLVETFYDEALGFEVPFRMLEPLGRALPSIREKFPTHASYAKASVHEMFGAELEKCGVVEVNWFESTAFLNRGGKFEPRELPIEAQFAPAFGVSVGDFDGDGNQDIFMSQNFFGVEPDRPRLDAGIGLALQGDGKGNFRALSALETGIRIYGEQRASATGDFDHDGRMDLAVTENAGETKLFRNIKSAPGIRVWLKRDQGKDPTGAILRVLDHEAPAQIVTKGTGYLSCDSQTQILRFPGESAAVEVRWPGGKVSKHSITRKFPSVGIQEP